MIITLTDKENKEYVKVKYRNAFNFVTCIINDILFVEFTYFSDNTSKNCRFYPATKLFILVKNN